MKAAKENFIFQEIKILIFALDKLYCAKHLVRQTEQKKKQKKNISYNRC